MHPQDTAQKLADLTERSGRQRRGVHAKRPKALKDLVAQLMTKRGYAATQSNQQLADAWTAAAGPVLARFSAVTRVNRSKLEVIVANSTMMQELTFEKQRILAALREALPDARISDLRMRVGKLN